MEELEAAAKIIAQSMPPTPQYCWPLLSQRVGAEVWVKHENHTPVGAFKIRGGLVYVDKLLREQPHTRGVIAATAGNFGQAIAFAAAKHGLEAVLVTPRGGSREKARAICALGAEIVEHGDDFQAASEHCAALAVERGLHRIPSFHPWLVEGTGVMALEMLSGCEPLDTVYVPIGLGSSICGMMAARDALRLKTRIVGVVAAGAPAYALSFAGRKPVAHAVSTHLADGLACRVPDEEALELMLRGVERIVTVREEEIGAAMAALYSDTHNVAEGAGAAAFAALLSPHTGERAHIEGKRIGAILSGGNVDKEIFGAVLQKSSRRKRPAGSGFPA